MKLAYTVKEAAEALGVSRRTVEMEMAAKRLRARKLGARTLIMKQDLEELLLALPERGTECGTRLRHKMIG